MNILIKLYKKISEKIDIPFFLFLLSISSNKIYLKFLALAIIFSLRPKFKFIFNKKLPLFYPFIILLSLVHFLFIERDFTFSHCIIFLVGVLYWLICYAYVYQTYLFTKINSISKINTTIITYVILNFAICVFNYFEICVKAQNLFPFLMGEGEFGASTGDHITGIFGQPSYINSMINFLFALYFIHQKQLKISLLVMFCAVLSFANTVNIISMVVLISYLILVKDNMKRLLIALNIVLCFFMYMIISPDNYNYVKKTIGLSVSDEKEIMPDVIIAEKNESALKVSDTAKQLYVNDSSAAKQKIVMYHRDLFFNDGYENFKTYYPVDIKSEPGKKIAIIQTLRFIKESPRNFLLGAGIGNFSSRLAFQFSGRDSSRLFKKMPKYCHGYYAQNHLLIFDIMKQLPTEYHSIKHFPNNFFSQIIGEYGIFGLALFLIFYIYFFYKRVLDKSFFIVLLICVSGFLMLDYLFEYFNIIVIVELILYMNIKENKQIDDKTFNA